MGNYKTSRQRNEEEESRQWELRRDHNVKRIVTQELEMKNKQFPNAQKSFWCKHWIHRMRRVDDDACSVEVHICTRPGCKHWSWKDPYYGQGNL